MAKSKTKEQPVDQIVWRDRGDIKANNYNPNRVASPELELLKISIMEDGWTQPIVINENLEIVDGFHRWTVSIDKDVYKLTSGKVPTVMLSNMNINDQKMSTIRHNRARGTHGVLDMSKIVKSMIESGLSQQEIESRLQMEDEEVIRLANRQGIPKSDIVQNTDWSKSWRV